MSLRQYEVDVLIVGGGPAGASAALSLAQHSTCSVALVEQSDFSRIRVGEHVSEDIFRLLDYLGLQRESFGEACFLPVYGSTAYWGSDQPGSTHAIFTTEAATYQLDRECFDTTLIEAAADRGVLVFPRSKCKAFQQEANTAWTTQVHHPEHGSFELHSRYLIDATGRSAFVSRQLGLPPTRADALTGVGLFFQRDSNTARLEQTIEATALGWWYVANLPDQRAVATLFTDAGLVSQHKLHQRDAWRVAFATTQQVRHLLEGARATSSKLWVSSAHSQLGQALAVPNFIAVGDAAASFDPFSSMGIGYSISSACHAARHVRHELSGGTPTTSVF